jgi:hypothetical protein
MQKFKEWGLKKITPVFLYWFNRISSRIICIQSPHKVLQEFHSLLINVQNEESLRVLLHFEEQSIFKRNLKNKKNWINQSSNQKTKTTNGRTLLLNRENQLNPNFFSRFWNEKIHTWILNEEFFFTYLRVSFTSD